MREPDENMKIAPVLSENEIRRCFPVVRQLRPHLDEETFIAQVKRQMESHGYSLVALEADGAVRSVAGYRVAEFLAWGKTLYVDDLITDEAARGKGFGGAVLSWLMHRARVLGCAELHLDSGVHRFDAHRLYLSHRMIISSHHFSKKLA